MITCGPGTDLYSTFGHTAIQVYDPAMGIDKVYNYGTFDFDTPNFYLKFAQGKLNYTLSVTTFERFIWNYAYEGRWVYRQDLHLAKADAEAMYGFLEANARPENRDYQYDFFYDNCSTRPRDVLEQTLGDRLVYSAVNSDTVATFRQMIDLYLGQHPWSRLGIYLALGIPCDRRADYREKMFLPDYLMAALSEAKLLENGEARPLLTAEGYLLPPDEELPPATSDVAWIFWLLMGVCAAATLLGKVQRWRWFDAILFATAGLLGIAIALLWWATDHSATKWNMNLLWALPTWLYAAVLVARGRTYTAFFKWQAILLFFVIVSWMWIPQRLHPAAIPLVIALMARSWAWQKSLYEKQQTP
jgi:hypothetical protein